MTFLQAHKVPFAFVEPFYMGVYKSGSNQVGVGASFVPVTNMVGDADTPADNVLNGGIIIPYEWPSYQAIVRGQIQHSGGSSPRKTICQIRRNASTLVTGATSTGSSGYAFASTTITVDPGDTFDLYWQGEGNYFNRPSCIAGGGTVLQIDPV